MKKAFYVEKWKTFPQLGMNSVIHNGENFEIWGKVMWKTLCFPCSYTLRIYNK